jgi:nicotinamidase-related amidase
MTTPTRTLPLPPHYLRANAARWDYRPNQAALADVAAKWRRVHRILPARPALTDVHLLLVDVQKDFCFPEGSLYVGGRSGNGAIDDNGRLAEFVYRNLDNLTDITTTMDTHYAYQIFFASFWVDDSGEPLLPFRTVTLNDIRGGKALPNPTIAPWLCDGDYAWLRSHVEHYVQELERAGKYALYLWPPHCILGSDGHPLAGVIHEARLFHALVRDVQSWIEIKGDNPLTENYSVFRPEVLTGHDGGQIGRKNDQFLKKLLAADMIVIAGQAASHCVKSSIDDLLDEILRIDPSRTGNCYVLVDCMSAVVVPDGQGGFLADFTSDAEAALARYTAAGMHLVRSTDPMESWPDSRLT